MFRAFWGRYRRIDSGFPSSGRTQLSTKSPSKYFVETTNGGPLYPTKGPVLSRNLLLFDSYFLVLVIYCISEQERSRVSRSPCPRCFWPCNLNLPQSNKKMKTWMMMMTMTTDPTCCSIQFAVRGHREIDLESNLAAYMDGVVESSVKEVSKRQKVVTSLCMIHQKFIRKPVNLRTIFQ